MEFERQWIMTDNSNNGKTKPGISQSMLIAFIGAGATILAALIPIFLDAGKPDATATFTSPPPAMVSTETVFPTAVAGFTPTSVPFTETPTLEPPTATPTVPLGIYDVYLALDKDGEHKSTIFSPQQSVYLFYSVNDPASLNNIDMVWYMEKVEGFQDNLNINTMRDVYSKVTPYVFMLYTPAWPPGDYRVEVFLNGQLADTQTQRFTVQK
jgi:hypothetical protein